MSIALTAAGTYTINSKLYQGSSSSGTLLTSTIANNVTALNFFNSFDSLAIGFRQSTSTAPNNAQLDINSINITFANIPLPEPASIGLLALGGSALLARRRRK
jgi:hypothetical protein